jgi:hypothetical protein
MKRKKIVEIAMLYCDDEMPMHNLFIAKIEGPLKKHVFEMTTDAARTGSSTEYRFQY